MAEVRPPSAHQHYLAASEETVQSHIRPVTLRNSFQPKNFDKIDKNIDKSIIFFC